MTVHDINAAIRRYLEAFERRDLEGCLSHFDREAQVHFQFSDYQGLDAIARWHQDRFDADLRVVEVSDVALEDSGAVIDATVASERLRRWHFDALDVVLTFRFREGRIADLACGLRTTPW